MPPITPATTERLVSGLHAVPAGPPALEGDPVVQAYVNHGRWIAECPACHAALVPPLRHPTFVCPVCRSAAVGGRAVELRWPAELEAGELALLVRPMPNRNWHPWRETVADLDSENMAHGYPSEPGALIATPDGLVERL